MSDLLLLLLTFIYVIAVLVISSLLRRFMTAEGARKFVHIAVAFTVFPVLFLDSPYLRLVGPVVFIAVNILIGKMRGERLAGLVLYPLSMLVLVIAYNSSLLSPAAVVTAMLTMGIGDGTAAIAGMRYGTVRIGKKTLQGSLCMLLMTMIVFLLFSDVPRYSCLLSAAVISVVECFSPSGFDNLTVPLVAAVLAEVL